MAIKQSEKILNLTDEIRLLTRARDTSEHRPEADDRLSGLRSALGRVEGQLATLSQVWDAFESQLRHLRQHFQVELENVRLKLNEQLTCDVRRVRTAAGAEPRTGRVPSQERRRCM
jgi:hypothetical protein